MQSLLILGRQPALGLAELESLYGKEKLSQISSSAVIVDVDPCLLAFDRLGGSVKFCKLLTTLDTTDWSQVEKFLIQVSPDKSATMPEGKMRLGLSLYGFSISPYKIMSTGLNLKKAIQKTGRSVRFIPNKTSDLNAAQVLHNQLTGPTGWELVFIRDKNKTIVAQTVKVQDIASYTKRDRERPKRDPKVGMLPPKLAQLIINLAVGKLPEDKLKSICDVPADQQVPPPDLGQIILDPFCGTGVVIQESLLMGYGVYATDLEPRMIDYTKQNVSWLKDRFNLNELESEYEVADATKHKWSNDFDFVATEVYLGQPFNTKPSPENLAKSISNCNLIIKKFMINIAPQLKPGTRLCLAVPAWQTRPNEFKFLPLIDQIEDLGYNRLSFEHIRNEDLIYYRSDQFVARQLLVLTKR